MGSFYNKNSSVIKNKDKVRLMRKLHVLTKEIFEIDNPHPLLHQLAVSEFGVESMSHISTEEVEILIGKIENSRIDWNKLEAIEVVEIPQMSDKQISLAKKLQRELGWSDDYMHRLAFKKYGCMDYKYLFGRAAIAYINYLIYRSREKRGIKTKYKPKKK